jgi:hypothetical protein
MIDYYTVIQRDAGGGARNPARQAATQFSPRRTRRARSSEGAHLDAFLRALRVLRGERVFSEMSQFGILQCKGLATRLYPCHPYHPWFSSRVGLRLSRISGRAAPVDPVAPSRTQSHPVKPSQTQSNHETCRKSSIQLRAGPSPKPRGLQLPDFQVYFS